MSIINDIKKSFQGNKDRDKGSLVDRLLSSQGRRSSGTGSGFDSRSGGAGSGAAAGSAASRGAASSQDSGAFSSEGSLFDSESAAGGEMPFSYKRALNQGHGASGFEGRSLLTPLMQLSKDANPAFKFENKVKNKIYERFQHDKNLLKNLEPGEDEKFYSALLDEVIDEVIQKERTKIPNQSIQELKKKLMDGIMGFGPIQKLLAMRGVTEVMVNGPGHVYFEMGGKLKLSDIKFRNNAEVMQIVEKIVIPLGRRCDEFTPYTDARLPDGSRVNIIIPPLSLTGPCITIRRFSETPLQISDLIRFGSITKQMAAFIKAAVETRLNVVVSGGTGSGKTTTLNAISSYIPPGDRIITIEDSAELQLQQPHVIRLETRQANTEGKGLVSIQDLFRNTLRMIPKRVVVGECRGGEALDMIAAMSSGTPGSLSTLHANTPHDCLARLETMIMMAGTNLNSSGIRELIAGALNVIVQQERLSDGKRRITYISEVTGIIDGEIQVEDIFRWVQTGVDEKGQTLGVLKATGYIPKALDRFFEWDVDLPRDLFEGVAPLEVLWKDWDRRRREEAKKEQQRLKAQVALQMAVEDRAVVDEMARLQEFGGQEEVGSRFHWKQAVAPDLRQTGQSLHGGSTGGLSTGGSTGAASGASTGMGSTGMDSLAGTGNLRSVRESTSADTQSGVEKYSLSGDMRSTHGHRGGALFRRLDNDTTGQVERESLTEQQLRQFSEAFNRVVLVAIPARLQAEMGDKQFETKEQEVKALTVMVNSLLDDFQAEHPYKISDRHRQRIVRDALADIVGLGPIQRYIDDPEISEVMVNGPRQIFVEHKGKLKKTKVTFKDNGHVMHIIQKIVSPLGRRCDESAPMVDARTQQGYRVNAIIHPLSLIGPVITIRKFSDKPYGVDQLVGWGTLSAEAAAFIDACIRLRLNVFVSGGTGSGKTTTLNAISRLIPECRIITVEDAAELRLQQEHVISLETRPANVEGKGAVGIRELVKNALHMRPDRIIVGECRGGEALDMIASMSTGNAGSLSTGHANSPIDLVRRLETMIMMSGVDLPIRAIREQIASAVDLVLQQDRFSDGSRKLTHISEVVGMERGQVKVQDIFRFVQRGVDPVSGKVIGQMEFTGVVPTFLVRFLDEGIELPNDIFGKNIKVDQLMRELDQKRRQEELEELKMNLKKSRAYEENVLFDADMVDGSENILDLLDEDLDDKTVADRIPDRGTLAGNSDVFNWRRCLREYELTAKVEEKQKHSSREENTEIVLRELAKMDLSQVLIGTESSFGDEAAERTFFIEHVNARIDEVLEAKKIYLKKSDRDTIALEIADDYLQLGPIQKFMVDEKISEIMVNGKDKIFIEQGGKIILTDQKFRSEDELMRILNRILVPIGRRCDINSPLVDARTKDGYRVNAVIPPVSGTGIVLTIRKFSKKPLLIGALVQYGALSQRMADFISGAVALQCNIVVSGGTGSGKTTTLNAISAFIPEGERIVTIEDTAELQLQQEHVVALETRPPNQEGKGTIPMQQLVRNSLRMRPDRIIIGECRGGEALDMLQAMNTGHEGSMTTGHASTPRDMMNRFETMVMMARSSLPSKSVREQISSAIDLIIQIQRFRDGSRRLTHISEVTGIREDQIHVEDIFVFQRGGYDADGRVKGVFKATGYLPSFLLRFKRAGISLPEDLFGEGTRLTQIYERLAREQKARESRESNREKIKKTVGMTGTTDVEPTRRGPENPILHPSDTNF